MVLFPERTEELLQRGPAGMAKEAIAGAGP